MHSSAFPYQRSKTVAKYSINSTPKYLSYLTNNVHSYKNLHVNIYRIFIHTYKTLSKKQMPNQTMGSKHYIHIHIILYPYNQIYLERAY